MDKEGEIPTCVYSPVLRKPLQETSTRLNPLFSLMTFKPIFPTFQEYMWITRFQVSEAGMHHLVKTDMLLEQGQKATCKKELNCYLASKIVIRLWNSKHSPD